MISASPKTTVAYFSMEIALDKAVPTYSGGLGVLAGDTLRSAADLSIPVVGVTLLHRKGYFEQHIDENGNQTEAPSEWRPETTLEAVDAHATVMIEGRSVGIRAWKFPRSAASTFSIARFTRSAAVPWMGVFTAVRSAALRAAGFLLLMSGRYRRRPNSVFTIPLVRAVAIVSSSHCFTFAYRAK